MSIPPSFGLPKFRVAICGGGIGGLTLAITIGKYDPCIPIDLYEGHDAIDTDGVGITVWPQTCQVMTDLGLLDDFRDISENKSTESGEGESPFPLPMVRGDIREGGYHWFSKTRNGPSSMHRQQMVAILEKHIPASCTVHAKKRLVNYVELDQHNAHSTSTIRLEFMDGTTATTDVLIGADGVRSAVRKSMFQAASKNDTYDNDNIDLAQYVDASFTGMTLYRFLIPTEALRKQEPENTSLKHFTAYCGKGKYFLTYPIAKGTLLNVVATVNDPSSMGKHYEGRWMSHATRDDVICLFDNFEPNVRTVTKLCDKPTKWAMHVVKPLPFCVRKRVALIGDASHAMPPFLGAGGGQAMDDAYILGRLLAHPLTSLSGIQQVLELYQAIRLPFAQVIAKYSLVLGSMFTFSSSEHYDGVRKADKEAEGLDDRGVGAYEQEGMVAIQKEVYRYWEFLDESHGVLQVWPEAEAKLQALVSSSSRA